MALKSKSNQKAQCIAILGTGSDVGKSIIATAMCRFLSNQGIRVAPFKAQNMSNNSGVTPEGLEMGRAQIVQAEAARLSPCVDMNPILLKPTTDVGSQVVLMGRVKENTTARDYHERKGQLEDTARIEKPNKIHKNEIQQPAIAVIRIPHISNFTDFDPLEKIDDLSLYFLESPQDLECFSAIILPGSKFTRWDLEWLHTTGWTDKILNYSKSKGHVLGICGGYQMMGEMVHDPDGIEGDPGTTRGLNLLPIETELIAPKITSRTRFSWNGIMGCGYEIHMGKTLQKGGQHVFGVHDKNGRQIEDEDGCITDDGRIMGTYIHGLFDEPEIIKSWLNQVGITNISIPNFHGLTARDEAYEKLVNHFENHIDVEKIMQLMNTKVQFK